MQSGGGTYRQNVKEKTERRRSVHRPDVWRPENKTLTTIHTGNFTRHIGRGRGTYFPGIRPKRMANLPTTLPPFCSDFLGLGNSPADRGKFVPLPREDLCQIACGPARTGLIPGFRDPWEFGETDGRLIRPKPKKTHKRWIGWALYSNFRNWFLRAFKNSPPTKTF